MRFSNQSIRSSVGLVTWLLVGVLVVISPSALANDFEAVESRLKTMIPDLSGVAISETPVDGLLEVRIGSDVIYLTSDGQHLLQGRLVDLDTRVDLTEVAKTQIRIDRLAELDSETFIQFGPDDAEHQILVFTDPDCGYCRRLHEQMDDYIEAGIQVNYLGFPRAGENSETYKKLVSVWCAADSHAAMDIAKSGGRVPEAECENPIMDHYQFGQSIGINGTPAILTYSGVFIPGYVPPDQLKARLDNGVVPR